MRILWQKWRKTPCTVSHCDFHFVACLGACFIDFAAARYQTTSAPIYFRSLENPDPHPPLPAECNASRTVRKISDPNGIGVQETNYFITDKWIKMVNLKLVMNGKMNWSINTTQTWDKVKIWVPKTNRTNDLRSRKNENSDKTRWQCNGTSNDNANGEVTVLMEISDCFCFLFLGIS